MAFETTLKKLRKRRACKDRYDHLVGALGSDYGDDTPIPILKILETNGIEDALWAFRACDLDKEEEKALGLYLCDIAEHVLHVYEKQYPDDRRPHDAIMARRWWLNGEIDNEGLVAVRSAAGAVWVAWAAARDAARAAARAAWDVWADARAAAWDAARAAARAAAGASAWASDWAAEREWQEGKLRELLGNN